MNADNAENLPDLTAVDKVVKDARAAEEHLEEVMPSAINPHDDDYAGMEGPASPAEEAHSAHVEDSIEDAEKA